MKISVAHATRRPAKALEIRKVWLDAAAHPDNVEYIFGIDEDDPESLRILANEPHTVAAAGGGCVRAFNQVAALTSGEIIIGGCDDMYPIQNWDTIIAERFKDVSKPLVMLVGDGIRQDRMATLPIITRAWYQRFGYLFPPEFKTVGPDIWLTERASRDGCLVNANDLTFEHRHPYYKKAPMDEVYEKQNAQAQYDKAFALLEKMLEPLPISLCMIVGNEQAVIERCLDSAKGVFDELCLVRALGSTLPDTTVSLAEKWCQSNGKAFRFAEYSNRIQFPHVDNFAAARNLSFDLATGYWCMWLDADDTIDEASIKHIRKSATNTRFDGQRFRYLMPTGGEFYRERLIKRGKGFWRNAVHETCLVTGDTCDVLQVEIVHSPLGQKAESSAARNLAILGQELDATPRRWFYYHEELLRLGRNAEALTAAHTALSILPPEMPVERYEIYLNLIDLDTANTEKWAFEAIRTDPTRREAFAYLTQCAVKCGDARKAAQYYKFLDSISAPNPKPWTHRAIWYGWARNYLRVMVLRAIGKEDQADKEHAEFMKDAAYAAGVGEHEEGK